MSFSTVPSKHEKAKSFHEIIGPVILIGNAFSIFPVSGIFSKSAENLKFRIFNPITIYAIIIQLCFALELVLLFIFLSKTGLKFFLVGKCSLMQYSAAKRLITFFPLDCMWQVKRFTLSFAYSVEHISFILP